MNSHHIGISLGQMRSLQDGLGEVSRQLCERIGRAAPALRRDHGIEIWIHCRQELHGLFGDQVHYLPISKWQRMWHRQPVTFDIWHSLHQLNKTLPPQGARHRMVTVHDLNYLYFKGRYSRWRDQSRMQGLMRRTDQVIAITRHTAEDVRRNLDRADEIKVVYNGVADLSQGERKALDGVATGFLFHLSRMSRSKNIEALKGLVQAWPEQRFLFAGPDGHDSRQVLDWRDRHGVDNLTVRLNLDEAEKAWAYANCSGFLFPSLTEGFGLPPMEAMFFGKPVFLSRLTSLPEVGGEVANYFDDFEPASMRSTVQAGLALADDPARCDALHRRAAGFSWDACTQAYIELYLDQLGLASDGHAGHPDDLQRVTG